MTSTSLENNVSQVCEDLSLLLSNMFTLFLKTYNYHWNVVDPRFSELHELFEKQVKEMFEQIDEIAERIRMLGQKTPATMKYFTENASLKEASGSLSGDEMIQSLARDHQALSTWLRDKIPEVQNLGDEGTADLYIQHLRAHDKTAWMLLSHHSKGQS